MVSSIDTCIIFCVLKILVDDTRMVQSAVRNSLMFILINKIILTQNVLFAIKTYPWNVLMKVLFYQFILKKYIICFCAQIWCGAGRCKAIRTPGILWGYDTLESRTETYNEKNRHLLLHEHYEGRELIIYSGQSANKQ